MTTNTELQQCIDKQQPLDIWIDDKFEERCVVVSFNEETIKTHLGCYYPRNNIKLVEGKKTKLFKFNGINAEKQ